MVIMRAGGIGVREVDFCGACDQEQTKVRNLPFGRFRGPLCPVHVAIVVPHFPHCTIWQPRCRGASAVLIQRQIRCFPYKEFCVGLFFLIAWHWTRLSSLFKYEMSLLVELCHDVKIFCSWALFRTFTFFYSKKQVWYLFQKKEGPDYRSFPYFKPGLKLSFDVNISLGS